MLEPLKLDPPLQQTRYKTRIECHGLDGKVKGKVDLLPYARGGGDIREDDELRRW